MTDVESREDSPDLHDRLASRDREEWVDARGTDSLPVFVTREGAVCHKRYGGCIDPEFSHTEFDLHAAIAEGYDPCLDCFTDDAFVNPEDYRVADSSDVNPARVLVARAYRMMKQTHEQDDIQDSDILKIIATMAAAENHPESDIWVTITATGPKNQLTHQLYPYGPYKYPPSVSAKGALENILRRTVEVNVRG